MLYVTELRKSQESTPGWLVFFEAPLASEFEQFTAPIAFCSSSLLASAVFLHYPPRK